MSDGLQIKTNTSIGPSTGDIDKDKDKDKDKPSKPDDKNNNNKGNIDLE